MKATATVILLLLLSVQTFSKWMWVLDYNLNQAYIAKTLCINKAKPSLHCNGHCQLRKKLAEDESGKEGTGTTMQKSVAYSLFFKTDIESELTPVIADLVQPQSIYVNRLCEETPHAVFHPPAV